MVSDDIVEKVKCANIKDDELYTFSCRIVDGELTLSWALYDNQDFGTDWYLDYYLNKEESLKLATELNVKLNEDEVEQKITVLFTENMYTAYERFSKFLEDNKIHAFWEEREDMPGVYFASGKI